MNKILNKIKEKGFIGTLKVLKIKIIMLFNAILYYVFLLFPINNNKIVLESEGDCSDNAYALFHYMEINQYLSNYQIVWLVSKVNNYSNKNGIEYCSKNISCEIAPKTMFSLATCKWYIYDHCNLFRIGLNLKSRLNQKVIFLSHGCTYKGYKGNEILTTKEDSLPHEMYITGDHFLKPMSNWANVPEERIISLGYPRLDWFNYVDSQSKQNMKIILDLRNYKNIILWMPTYRQSNNKKLSEDYIINETGLPLVNTKSDIDNLNLFLSKNNQILILKLHHLQLKLSIFDKKWSHIRVLKDEQLQQNNIQLYQFITLADVLITDLSSVSNDYLLLDKPIIFTLDDYEEYKKSRGLYPIDIKSTMKGYHVYNMNDLYNSLSEIISGKDKYSFERNKWKMKCHKYVNGFASKRILDHLGIFKINK